MVSLRSGTKTKDVTSDKTVADGNKQLQKGHKKPVLRENTPRRTAEAPTGTTRAISRHLEKLDFLASPGVQTRTAGPIPAISLSTELPEEVPAKSSSPDRPPPPGKGATLGDSSAKRDLPSSKTKGQRHKKSEKQECPTESTLVTRKDLSARTEECQGHQDPPKSSQRTGDTDTDSASNTSSETNRESAKEMEECQALPEQQPSDRGAPMPGEVETESVPGDTIREGEEKIDSDSDSDEDPLGGLAAGMWKAIQDRQIRNVSHETQTSRVCLPKQQQAVKHSDLAKRSLKEEAELRWHPKADLPCPLKASDADGPRRDVGGEANLSKKLLVPPRDLEHDGKARKANQPRPWHELPVTPMTDEVKRDLRLLRLRGAMDTKRFYKKGDKGKFPTNFAFGTVIEGPTEWYSGRLTRKQRKQNITEELLADAELQSSRKRRYGQLQEENSRWSHKKHKGSGERLKKKVKKPKY